uniref:Uncharacterized protein n=1 Tax=Arundo donax TaxID=35708 RepID=A0A0A9G2X8_ARUDO
MQGWLISYPHWIAERWPREVRFVCGNHFICFRPSKAVLHIYKSNF